MKLSKFQRIILVVYAIVIINICVFFAPKSLIIIENGTNIVRPIEYSPIWHSSHYFETLARKQNESSNDIANAQTIDLCVRTDYYRMASEAFAVTVITGVLLVLTMPKKEG